MSEVSILVERQEGIRRNVSGMVRLNQNFEMREILRG